LRPKPVADPRRLASLIAAPLPRPFSVFVGTAADTWLPKTGNVEVHGCWLVRGADVNVRATVDVPASAGREIFHAVTQFYDWAFQ